MRSAGLHTVQEKGMHHGVRTPPVMETIRTSGRFARTVAVGILALFLNAVIWPSWAVAIEGQRQEEVLAEARWEAENKHLHQVLKHIKQQVGGKKEKIDRRLAERDVLDQALDFLGLSRLAVEETEEIGRLAKRASRLNRKALEAFDSTGKRLLEKGLPEKILQRHQKARQQFIEKRTAMERELGALLAADTLRSQQAAAAELKRLMNSFTQEKPRDPFDPDNLPWGTPDPSKTPAPAMSAEELSARTGLSLFEQGAQLAGNVITADMLGNPGGPVQADLDPTPDVQITEAIEAKAQELNHDPVQIYQWVRNNIEFIPSYGSIQGADYTLQNGKGNAFDTASLLIALLRASNIPARYAFGTVSMPIDKVMNWVGDVEVPEAAGNLVGQGGIPNTLVSTGGQITHMNLEHVWVEAWVDFVPSRGAAHKVGDHWIPMDASYKQYEYTDGMVLEEQVPFDAQGLADTIEQQSTINEAEGWIQNVPQQEIETAITDYQTQLEAFLENQAPDATVGDVLGSQSIKTVIHRELPGSLPYHKITHDLVTSSLPSDLRWKFKYQLNTSTNGYPGATLLKVERPTTALAGKQLGLSFKPATPEDEETLKSYLPVPDANEEIDLSRLPDTLPGYLIHLKGEFHLGGEVVATAATETAMGAELYSEMGYWKPMKGWQASENRPIAGEYRAVGLSLQGTSQEQAQRVQAGLESTKAKLENGDFSGLTTQQVVGDLLYGTILSYMSLNEIQDKIAERQGASVGYRSPSYGLFKTSLVPVYWFGVPREVKSDGLGMDVDRMENLRVDKKNDSKSWVNFNRIQGSRMSAMEHSVPENVFSSASEKARSISAVKAISLAQAESQKIYTITNKNMGAVLSDIKLSSEIKDEINIAIRSGKQVTTHNEPVYFAGKNYVGYIISDPKTGAGAYKISGGENGSETSVPRKTDWVTWLISILEKASKSPLLKGIGGFLNEIIAGINLYLDIDKCGYAFGIAKFFAGILSAFAIGFVLLPYLALLLSIYMAYMLSMYIGLIVSGFFAGQWSCKDGS